MEEYINPYTVKTYIIQTPQSGDNTLKHLIASYWQINTSRIETSLLLSWTLAIADPKY